MPIKRYPIIYFITECACASVHKCMLSTRTLRLFIVLAGLLGATPGVLLQDDELQDEFGCPTRPLHHHRVSAVFQNFHSAFGQHLFNDHGSGDIDYLDRQ